MRRCTRPLGRRPGEDTVPEAAKRGVMISRLVLGCAVAAAVGLAACQGNVGNGGLSIPQAPQYGQQTAGGAATATSRQRALEGAVTYSASLGEIPLPAVDGFSIAVELGAAPAASPSPSPAATGSGMPNKTARGLFGASAAEAATLAPSGPPAATASPSPAPAGSAPASAAPSGAASGAAPASSATPSGASKIATKTIAYPDDAPAAPTPRPTGDVQTFAKRTALVRGYLESGTTLSLYGLGAIRVTIPAEEAKAARGFTVAFFETGRKHHESLVASDAGASFANGVVTANGTTPLVVKKNVGYLIVLYGDELPATPAPIAPGYPSPGLNPFVTPAPSGAPYAPVTPTPAHF